MLFSRSTVFWSCVTSSATPRTVPPLSSASMLVRKRSRLSFTAGNAAACPVRQARSRARGAATASASRSPSRRRRRLRRSCRVEEHHRRGEHEEHRQQHAEDLELLDHGQMSPMRQMLPGLPRRRRRRAQLLHDRDRRRAGRSPLRVLAHLGLRRRHVEVASRRRLGFSPNNLGILNAM